MRSCVEDTPDQRPARTSNTRAKTPVSYVEDTLCEVEDTLICAQGNILSIIWCCGPVGQRCPGSTGPSDQLAGCGPHHASIRTSIGKWEDVWVFDDIERDALRSQGFDPHDLETSTAIDLVLGYLSVGVENL